MPSALIDRLRRWGLPVLAVCAAWAGGRLSSVDVTAAARTAPGLAPLERLLIEDDIRQQIGLYALYADGDGPGGRPRDLRTLADTLMTPDVVSELHPPNGAPQVVLNGREVIAKTPTEVDPDRAKRVVGRHYLVNTVFDSVTPTTAETRTIAVYFDATRKSGGPNCRETHDGECGEVPVRTVMWVYQMSWRKTPQGWQMFKNILRDDN